MSVLKEYKMYRCEHCGTMYNSEQKATKCEESHILCHKIVREVHKPMGVDLDYPTEVLIQMKNGKEVVYKRAYVASKE